ncbi:uncharacterized protein [Aristolochia californica]|uniref:uncharacterized protein n=1 Tax=Aristolochia californica TaxID=171875 RepID=UPI0035E1A36C
MKFFLDDDDFGKCRKHPSQPRHGVCAVCLKDRLTMLCPDCSRLRPCSCYSFTDFTSSASSSSSLDIGVGSGAPMSFLIDNEPPLRRSRSVAFSFLRPKPDENPSFNLRPPPPENPTKSFPFWSFLKSDKPKKKTDQSEDLKKKKKTDNFPRSKSAKYPRSKSVGTSCYSDIGEVSGGVKGWGWHFPSPIKVFLHPKPAKVARERSPLCRG